MGYCEITSEPFGPWTEYTDTMWKCAGYSCLTFPEKFWVRSYNETYTTRDCPIASMPTGRMFMQVWNALVDEIEQYILTNIAIDQNVSPGWNRSLNAYKANDTDCSFDEGQGCATCNSTTITKKYKYNGFVITNCENFDVASGKFYGGLYARAVGSVFMRYTDTYIR